MKTEREAAFAFKLAREATGFTKATYKKGPGSRRSLALDQTFGGVFIAAKQRVRAMEYRGVEETDPTCQCLLEIYVSRLTTILTPISISAGNAGRSLFVS
jgi:hypothetical protein